MYFYEWTNIFFNFVNRIKHLSPLDCFMGDETCVAVCDAQMATLFGKDVEVICELYSNRITTTTLWINKKGYIVDLSRGTVTCVAS